VPPARVVKFPNISPKTQKALLQGEIGTAYDAREGMFAYTGDGELLDYGDWNDRDVEVMLDRDGRAGAIEAVLTLPIRQASRAIEKADGDDGEAEFARSVLMTPHTGGGMKTPLQDVIGQLTSAQTFRRAFFEKVWTTRDTDGRMVYEKLAFRPSATCEIKRDERTAALTGFRQQVWSFGQQGKALTKSKMPGWVDIPFPKAWVYINGKHRKPLTGTSELQISYWCWRTKVKLVWLWLTYLEQQSLPKVITYGASQDIANARADDVASMRASGIVGFETNQDEPKTFDIIESSGKGGDQFAAALSFLETWQTSSVLAGFMGLSDLASLGRGSLALSQDQSAFFLKSRQAVTAEMEAAITHDVIAPLVTLNFGPSAAFPSFKFGALTDESGQSLVALFQALAVAPALQVPAGILDVITERLATYLNLPMDSVHQIIEAGAQAREAQAVATAPDGMPKQAAAGVGRLAGGVSAAAKLAERALKDSAKAPLPEDITEPMTTAPGTR
jgi:hypothetical protein